MVRFWIAHLLLEAGAVPAQGQEGPAEAPNFFRGLQGLLVPMALVFFIFWLLVFRPESRKRKERERMISAVKKGDRVLTTGGLLGKVWRVEAGEVTVVIDKDRDVKGRFTKSAILEVLRPEDASKGNGSGGKDGQS